MKMKKIIETMHRLTETSNTLGADINEIVFAYLAAGNDWGKIHNSEEVQQALDARKAQVSPEVYDNQVGRARAMVQETLEWAAANGWEGEVTQVWWTARPGVLAQAVGRTISRGNPTDVLLQFNDDEFLGVSAKSTKSSGDIGFKNPGVGSIATALGIDLDSIIQEESATAIKNLDLPSTARARKLYLQAHGNDMTRAEAEKIGRRILGLLRHRLHQHLTQMQEEDIRTHLLQYWMDAGENYPYYIKVTGRGTTNTSFSATLVDPIQDEQYKALMSDEITVDPIGTDSIGVYAGGKRIMKMRFKYESQKLGSSVKMSGDSWKDRK